MCRQRNIALHDYQESAITGQTHGQTDAGQSDPYVPLCSNPRSFFQSHLMTQEIEYYERTH